MGNDMSKLKGLVMDQNAIEVNDFWTLYNAEAPTTVNEDGWQLLSIFQGKSIMSGQIWLTKGTMERAIKNFMIYRHPYILKYNSTWEEGGQKYLATERVRPLSSVIATQTEIQVCLGLRTILCSLVFLVERAMARHLNICTSSIYITDNGSWRLAGFEFVWKNKQVTKTLLELVNEYRHKSAIAPDETTENNSDFIEQYAFATMCEELLSKCTKTSSATPFVEEFREYCAVHLTHVNAQMRPKLSAVLLHPFFNHEFILIHSFMFELPVKSAQEKQEFFTGLIDRLRYFNEEVVGAHLAGDLLSRMVLTDPTAQLCVTPYVLRTKTDHSAALFSNSTYAKHLIPHIFKMFRLRDAQIRLILLEYFTEFVRLLTKADLEEFILPHLLAGMNDVNDVLVAKTLRCLADLVPILGSTKVIGGERARLFSDGRPQAAVPDSTTHWVEPRSITPVIGDNEDFMVSSSPLPDIIDVECDLIPELITSNIVSQMPLQLNSDSGDDNDLKNINALDKSNLLNDLNAMVEESSAITLEDDDVWSDWDNDELQRLNGDNLLNGHKSINDDASVELNVPTLENHKTLPPCPTDLIVQGMLRTTLSNSTLPTASSLSDSLRTTQSNTSSTYTRKPTKINDDLDALDIKIQTSSTSLQDQSSDFDFFKDMEPVIESQSTSLLNAATHIPVNSKAKSLPVTAKRDEEVVIDTSRFAAIAEVVADGWQEDESNDWET
ncbi:protein-associating with the carboxyl-terminal domain of ezrin [Teleopsis dalmanni]|uniref:protein-associating with the carboxyl-terminal domain of ezrin n=1 Tax=Teleopsis dalmanni TaxID=139649 RepID=UPI000D3295A7|nr:protein-associating with the carboxyl-terminal domain of ezrin [Teleopsis dalmanni]